MKTKRRIGQKNQVSPAKKGKKGWQDVPIDDEFSSNKEFENLISFEVLHDYTIVKKPLVVDPTIGTTSKRKLSTVSGDKLLKKSKLAKEGEDDDDGIVNEDPETLEDSLKVSEDEESNDVLATTGWNVQESPSTRDNQSGNIKGKKGKKQKRDNDDPQTIVPADINYAEVMPDWVKLGAPNPVLKALYENKFENPTSIQVLTLPPAIFGKKDIVGAAETGSGKTLAFAIPIIDGILKNTTPDVDSALQALILTPTRELAVQIKNHIEAAAKYTNIKVVVIMGGLAPQKQERLLRKNPEIVIATPGRLWELVREGNDHLSKLGNIKYLAIDETDRMVEKGHFQELEGILGVINSNPTSHENRQNFVFSATLSFTHEPPQRLKKISNKTKKNKQQPKKVSSAEKLRQIMDLVGVRENSKIIDITSGKGTCETLTEMQITCRLSQKDYYLYYFFVRHPGRTIIFCNSINCVRRLTNLFFLLKCEPMPLHSEMQQKQRLRNLEKFAANDTGILIATDVAARGLDIVDIQHVIHYQVPKSAESYIHRSGRTARAFKGGLALILIEPKEVTSVNNIWRSLERDEELPSFQVEGEIFRGIKERVDMAVKVEAFEHTVRKKFADQNWLEKAKKEMDLASSEDDTDDEDYQRGTTGVKTNLMHAKKELDRTKERLDDLLSVNLYLAKRGSGDVRTTFNKMASIRTKPILKQRKATLPPKKKNST